MALMFFYLYIIFCIIVMGLLLCLVVLEAHIDLLFSLQKITITFETTTFFVGQYLLYY